MRASLLIARTLVQSTVQLATIIHLDLNMTDTRPGFVFSCYAIACMCIVVGVIVFLIVFFVAAKPRLDSQSFDEAICTVKGHRALTSKTTTCNYGVCSTVYQALIDVDVNAGRSFWQGRANYKYKYWFSSSSDANDFQLDHPVNTTDTCYYDPDEKTDLVYERSSTAGYVGFLVGALLALVIGCGCGLGICITLTVLVCIGKISIDD